VDGEPLEVTSVDGVVLAVQLPGGLEGAELRVEYAPTMAKLAMPALAIGLIGVVAAAFVPVRRRRASVAQADEPLERRADL
jgi:hypothetical protein